jgi:purine-nucleoside phosphorylase
MIPMINNLEQKLEASLRYITSRVSLRPEIGIVLGSGLGNFTNSFQPIASINIADIPHYPRPTVAGHTGSLLFGKYAGRGILAFRGRIHYYETGDMIPVLYPINVAKMLGVRTLLLTNAAGGIHSKLKPGDFMLLKDHINLTFVKFPRIVSAGTTTASPVYDKELRNKIKQAAAKLKIKLKEGVYCGLKGPSYETASEIAMLDKIGADAVGMSTVNEAALAHALGMRVAGISCITNLSTGISDAKLSHAEVTVVANTVKSSFNKLIAAIIDQFVKIE